MEMITYIDASHVTATAWPQQGGLKPSVGKLPTSCVAVKYQLSVDSEELRSHIVIPRETTKNIQSSS